jgi:hypothetical protein
MIINKIINSAYLVNLISTQKMVYVLIVLKVVNNVFIKIGIVRFVLIKISFLIKM